MKTIIEKIRVYGIKTVIVFTITELIHKLKHLFINSYSQHGEDLIIDKFLKYKKNGFYVDVGANDPERFSNTMRFYKNGWRGINIEPDYNNYKKLTEHKSQDINVHCGIGLKNGELDFYRFTTHTLSTFSKEEADNYVKQGYSLEEKIKVPVRTLSDILAEHAKDKTIDFISIDTEGFDMQVLMSNDWMKYRPTLICIECARHESQPGAEAVKDTEQEDFLTSKGYKKVFDNNLNAIYMTNT
jgi:FkbM family methyltransferase